MAEYIEREALLKTHPFTKCGGNLNAYNDGYLDCVEDAREAVRITPAADVVEVVRCKDCKWMVEEGYCVTNVKGAGYKKPKPDDFCSYGKRKDGADNER